MAELSALDRFLSKIRIAENGCWIWTGQVNLAGYGIFSLEQQPTYAHRAAYLLLIGPIPDGLVVDHTCHNKDLGCAGGSGCLHRRCVNAFEHLEPVPSGVNSQRGRIGAHNLDKTRCPKGHPYDAANTYLYPDGRRDCRICARESKRRYKVRKRIERRLLTALASGMGSVDMPIPGGDVDMGEFRPGIQ